MHRSSYSSLLSTRGARVNPGVHRFSYSKMSNSNTEKLEVRRDYWQFPFFHVWLHCSERSYPFGAHRIDKCNEPTSFSVGHRAFEGVALLAYAVIQTCILDCRNITSG